MMRQGMVMLDEDSSFSLTANVLAPGYQSVVVKGYLVSKQNGETWIAPLIPQLFYGIDGEQLTSWRQYIPTAGSQIILSRSGGDPSVPREDLWWRKVPSREETLAAADNLVQSTISGVIATPDFKPLLLAAAIFFVFLWGK